MHPESDLQMQGIVLERGAEPIPNYRLVERIGKGGFGEVWKAEASGGFHVALKFVRLAGEIETSELRALEILRTIRHPNLLVTFGAWQTRDFLVIAMELANGTLWDRFRQALDQGLAGIPREELLEYIWEAARGLDYLNEPQHLLGGQERRGVQHRDVKPQNILVVGNGVKLADFGLAKVFERSHASNTGRLTPAYAAPEFFRGQTASTSDQYSLAVTYTHLRGGKLPFAGGTFEILGKVLTDPPDLSHLPEEEQPIVARALSKDPEQRWPNCRTFVEALRACKPGGEGGVSDLSITPRERQGDLSTVHPQSGPVKTPTEPSESGRRLSTPLYAPGGDQVPPRGHGVLVAVVGVALLAAGVVGGIIWYRNQESQPETSRPEPITTKRKPAENPPVPEPKPQPQLALELPSKPLDLKAGGDRQPFTIKIRREAVAAPVQIRFEGLPPGITIDDVAIPDGNTEATAKALATLAAGQATQEIRVVGKCGPAQASGILRLTVHRKVGEVFRFDGPHIFPGDLGGGEAAAFCADGRRVLLGGERGVLRLVDLQANKELLHLTGHKGAVYALALANQDRLALSGGEDGTVRLWDLVKGVQLRVLTGHDGAVWGVALTADGQQALSGGEDGTLRLWDTATGNGIQRFAVPPKQPVYAVALSRDGKYALSGSGEIAKKGGVPVLKQDGSKVPIDCSVRLWDVVTGKELHRFDGHTAPVQCLAFAPDGKHALSGSADETVRLWDLVNSKAQGTFTGHREMVNAVAFSEDGQWALSGSLDKTVRLWKVDGSKPAQQVSSESTSVQGVAFAFASTCVLFSSRDGTVVLWALPSGPE
jgi:serine/threonine protein kinase